MHDSGSELAFLRIEGGVHSVGFVRGVIKFDLMQLRQNVRAKDNTTNAWDWQIVLFSGKDSNSQQG